MKKSYLPALLVIALFAASMQAVFAQDILKVSESKLQKKSGYLVRPRDKIEGRVLGENQFNFTVTVDEDGMFEVPFVDKRILAKCRTERDIREDIKKHLSKYLKKPLISVQVVERRKPAPVIVAGEVVSKGQVALTRETRLLEVLNFSGGAKDSAGGSVRVFRPLPPMCSSAKELANWREKSNNGKVIPSKMYKLSAIKAGRKEHNPLINNGDIIVVEKAFPVYINGEIINKSGVYIKEGGLTLTQAIAMAGGVGGKAKVKDIRIYRKIPNSQDRDIIHANLKLIKEKKQKDIMLKPYDIIDIEKKGKSVAEVISDIMIGTARSGAFTIATTGAQRVLY